MNAVEKVASLYEAAGFVFEKEAGPRSFLRAVAGHPVRAARRAAAEEIGDLAARNHGEMQNLSFRLHGDPEGSHRMRDFRNAAHEAEQALHWQHAGKIRRAEEEVAAARGRAAATVGTAGLLGTGAAIAIPTALAHHRKKHASAEQVIELYKEAGFITEGVQAAGKALARGGAAVQRNVATAVRGGLANPLHGSQISNAIPTGWQKAQHAIGQGMTTLGKGIQKNPGTALAVGGLGAAGVAGAGAAGAVAGRATAPGR